MADPIMAMSIVLRFCCSSGRSAGPTRASPVTPHSVAIHVLLSAAACASFGQEVDVQVEKRGEMVVIDARASVASSVPLAWAVLTDYEHMPSFVSDLRSSAVRRRQGNSLEVAQSVQVKFGPFSLSFASIQAVELTPMRRIRSHFVSGDFKFYESTTHLIDQGTGVLITNHGEYAPKGWLPQFIGTAAIEAHARQQFSQLVAEIARRKTVRLTQGDPGESMSPSDPGHARDWCALSTIAVPISGLIV